MKKLILFLLFLSFTLPTFAQDKYYYLAQWEWFTEGEGSFYWRCPGGDCLGTVDLRSIPQMSKAGGVPEGFGFFVYDAPQTISKSLYLGNDLNKILSAQNKNKIQIALGLTLDSNTPLDILWELLTTKADPTGQTAPKPLRGKLGGEVKLYLANKLVKSEPFNEAHRQRTIAVFQADYKRNKADGVPLETLNRWTGDTMKKLYGQMSDNNAAKILPPEYVADGWEVPHTVITESFNTGVDQDLLGPDLTWTELLGDIDIVSNTARTASTTAGRARAESDLASDDHYAQAVVNHSASGARNKGLILRKDATATITCYECLVLSGTNTARVYKQIDNVQTQRAESDTFTFTAGSILYFSVDGSTLVVESPKGTNRITVTDPDVTGNTRCGLRGNAATAGEWVSWDDFEAGDLVAFLRFKGVKMRGLKIK